MRRLIVLAVVALTALSATPLAVETAAAAGPVPSLCTLWTPNPMDTSRGAVPSNFYLDACVTGTTIVIANTTGYPVRLVTSGSAGPISFSQQDTNSYSAATRSASDPSAPGTLVLPGDVMFIPVGAQAGSVTVVPSPDDFDSYSFYSSLFALIPGVNASDAVNQLGDTMVQLKTEYEQCLNAGRARKARTVICAGKLTAETALALVIFANNVTPIKGVEDLVQSLVQVILSAPPGELTYIGSFQGMATELDQSASGASTLPDAVENTPYSATLPGLPGGTPPYTWQKTSGSLPNPLTLDPTTGVISGTPPLSACFVTPYTYCTTVTSAFTVQVTDSQGQTGSIAEQIRVQPSPMCTAGCSLQVALGVANGAPALIVTSPAQAPCGAVPVQCQSILFVRDPDGSVQGFFAFGWRGPNWLQDIGGTKLVAYSTCSPGQSEWADVATWDGIHPFQLVAVSNVVQC